MSADWATKEAHEIERFFRNLDRENALYLTAMRLRLAKIEGQEAEALSRVQSVERLAAATEAEHEREYFAARRVEVTV